MSKRDSEGRFIAGQNAMSRFVDKCKFDPGTGCVIWTAGRTSGQARNVEYGAFWFEGRRWTAHRWAAKYIHGLDIDDPSMQVDHCCEPIPNSLCVQHLQVITAEHNRELVWQRVRKRFDGGELFEPAEPDEPFTEMPFFTEPEWMKI